MRSFIKNQRVHLYVPWTRMDAMIFVTLRSDLIKSVEKENNILFLYRAVQFFANLYAFY